MKALYFLLADHLFSLFLNVWSHYNCLLKIRKQRQQIELRDNISFFSSLVLKCPEIPKVPEHQTLDMKEHLHFSK